MKVQELKTRTPMFQQVWIGDKTAELRKNDREYEEGDILWLREWSKEEGYGKHYVLAQVTHILQGEEWGLQAGYVMLSMRVVEKGLGRPRKLPEEAKRAV